MANPVVFSEVFPQAMWTKNEEQKLDYLTALFHGIALKSVDPNEPLMPVSGFRQIAQNAYNFLYNPEESRSGMDADILKTMLERGVEETRVLSKRFRNTTALKDLIVGCMSKGSLQVSSLLESGVNLSNYELYRLAFQYQSLDTRNIVKIFLSNGMFPNERNLCHLIAQNTRFTHEIMQLFRPYREVTFSSACLTYALKHLTRNQAKVVSFLMSNGIVPTEKQYVFARRHCWKEVGRSFKNACKGQPFAKKMGNDGLFLCRKSEGEKEIILSPREAIKNQDDMTMHHLLHHYVKRGISGLILDCWVQHPGGSNNCFSFIRTI